MQLCLSGFELYSRWVPLISLPLQSFVFSEKERIKETWTAYAEDLIYDSVNVILNLSNYSLNS